MSFAAYYVPGAILGFENEAVSIFWHSNRQEIDKQTNKQGR